MSKTLKIILSLISLIIFFYLILGSYNIFWVPYHFPQYSNLRYKAQSNQDFNIINYPYCLLTQIHNNTIYCSFLNYAVISKTNQAQAYMNTLKQIQFNIPYSRNTKIFFNQIQISPSDLTGLQIPTTGMPVQIQIKYKTHKPTLTISHFFNHIFFTLTKHKPQNEMLQVTHITIDTIPTPQNYFANYKKQDYLNYIKTKVKKLPIQSFMQSPNFAYSITCNLDECSYNTNTHVHSEDINQIIHKLTPPADTILQKYCKLQLKNSYQKLPNNPFATTNALQGIEVVDIFFMPNPFLECKYKPPKLIPTRDTIKQLAYAIYLNQNLSAFKTPTLIYSTTIPYLTNPARNSKTIDYGIIFSPAGNLLLQKYVDLILQSSLNE